MSQQTVNFGATQVAEPPAPLLPTTDGEPGPDNRRKLMLVGAVVGIAVLALAAFFLLKGGSNPAADAGGLVPHGVHKAPAAAAAAPAVKLPKRVVTPVGRDPFKALIAPAAAAPAAGTAGSASGTGASTGTTSGTGTSSSTGTATPTTVTPGTTTSVPTYRPVWIRLKTLVGSTATFQVGFSDGKNLRAFSYTVKASSTKAVSFANDRFALESLRNGVATVMFGDGSPFQLDLQHNTMVVG